MGCGGCAGTGAWGGTEAGPRSALSTAEGCRPFLNGVPQPFVKITAGSHLGFREFRVEDKRTYIN